MRKYILYIVLFIAIGVHAQIDSISVPVDKNSELTIRQFDNKQFEAYKNDPDFNYTEPESKTGLFNQFTNWLIRVLERLFEWLFGVEEAVGYLASFLRWLPYIILGILILAIVYFFVKLNVKSIENSKREKASVFLSDDEEIIRKQQIEALIKQAVSDSNYRLAVRFYYLLILQKLQEKELIVWQQQKTNADYIHELNSSDLRVKFIDITRLYDFVWYGSFEIDEQDYLNISHKFESIKVEIGV
ncbi:hypothetical protein KH5_20550 [Urechidicola sp. KH5]